MSDREQAISTIVEAFKAEPGEQITASVAAILSDDASMRSMRGKLTGRDAVAAALAGPDFRRFFTGGTWQTPEEKDGSVVLAARVPLKMPSGGGTLALEFDGGGKVAHVELWSIPAPLLDPEELKLTPDIKDAVNNSMVAGAPMLVSYIDAEGQPHMTYRGTAQAFSDTQLAIWSRSVEGDFLKGTAINPRVTLFYRNPGTRALYQFFGRARVTEDEAERRQIFDNSPEIERNVDPDRLGVATIIDLDQVEGITVEGRIFMRRRA